MLDIQITIKGDKIILEGLNRISKDIPGAVKAGLERSAKGIYAAAFKFLSDPGAQGKTTGKAYQQGGKRKIKGQKWTPQSVPAGGYPVPVRTGNLLKLLGWLHPGQSKTGPVGTFTAGPHEVVIYDSAIYANVVHEGKWTHAKHGPRRYLTDALERFNRGGKIKEIVEEEIQKAINDSGI